MTTTPRVAIIGIAQSVFQAEKRDATVADLIYDVASRAMKDAGMRPDQIGNIVTGSNDFLDGRTISSMPVGDAAGAAVGDGKNISTVEGDGTFVALYGLSRILSGAYASTLVVTHCKPSEGNHHLITNACFDPIYERPLGLDWVSAAALQARAFMDHSGFNEQGLAGVVVRSRKNGTHNPNAHLREELGVRDALTAEPLAPPIKRSDAAPLSDGAAAIVLARENVALKFSKKPVWIEGVACSADARMTHRDLWESPALRRAAKAAYEMAGVKNPAKELSVAEIYEAFSYQEPMWLKELGLEEMPKERVNPSGGCLCAHTPIAAGLVRMIEAALQLRGEASNQIDGAAGKVDSSSRGAKRALAHGQNGLCGQSHCVWILGS